MRAETGKSGDKAPPMPASAIEAHTQANAQRMLAHHEEKFIRGISLGKGVLDTGEIPTKLGALIADHVTKRGDSHDNLNECYCLCAIDGADDHVMLVYERDDEQGTIDMKRLYFRMAGNGEMRYGFGSDPEAIEFTSIEQAINTKLHHSDSDAGVSTPVSPRELEIAFKSQFADHYIAPATATATPTSNDAPLDSR